MRRVIGLVASLVVLGTPLQAQAVDPGHGTPGFCPTDEGVTVVIDFQALGGTTIVRCAPGPVGRDFTGHSALVDAGIRLEGTRRWGESFVCRLEGRPGANEKLPIRGNADYREACIDTPPAAGYWSYWHASNGGQWQYSQWGVKNRRAIRGGFEGWSFSLNATAKNNPRPRIRPIRPDSEPQPEQPAVAPTGNDPAEQQQQNPVAARSTSQPRRSTGEPGSDTTVTVGGDRDQPQVNTAEPTMPGGSVSVAPVKPGTGATALPPGLPRSGSPAPQSDGAQGDVPWTGGEPVAASNNSGSEPAGVPVLTVLCGFAALLLLAGAVITAQHRRGRRS